MIDDLISRRAAIDAVRQFYDEFSDNEKSIEEIIADLPSVRSDVHDRNVGEWDMFELITSTYYGKMMYAKQENGIIYSRYSCKYMQMDEAIKEFLVLISD